MTGTEPENGASTRPGLARSLFRVSLPRWRGGQYSLSKLFFNFYFLAMGSFIAIAIGSGAIGCTIVTDSLFWLVKQYCGASLSETFKYYTTATFIASLLALAATFLLSFII